MGASSTFVHRECSFAEIQETASGAGRCHALKLIVEGNGVDLTSRAQALQGSLSTGGAGLTCARRLDGEVLR